MKKEYMKRILLRFKVFISSMSWVLFTILLSIFTITKFGELTHEMLLYNIIGGFVMNWYFMFKCICYDEEELENYQTCKDNNKYKFRYKL